MLSHRIAALCLVSILILTGCANAQAPEIPPMTEIPLTIAFSDDAPEYEPPTLPEDPLPETETAPAPATEPSPETETAPQTENTPLPQNTFDRELAEGLLDIVAETTSYPDIEGFEGRPSAIFFDNFMYQILNEMYYDASQIEIEDQEHGGCCISQETVDELFVQFFAEGVPPALDNTPFLQPLEDNQGYMFYYSDRDIISHRFDIVSITPPAQGSQSYQLVCDLVQLEPGEEGELDAWVMGRYSIRLVESSAAAMGYLLDAVLPITE